MQLVTVGVIILHFGRWELTQACLQALARAKTSGMQLRVVVVNNAQDPWITTTLKTHPLVTKVIEPTQNLGFAQGNNVAIAYCQKMHCSYVLLVNNDAEIESGCLQALLKAAQAHPQPRLLGAVIKHQVGTKTYYDYGGVMQWLKGQPRHVNRTQLLRPKSPLHVITRDFVSGCCLWIPMAIIKKIGPLAQDYFMYLEDVEYCLRAKRSGYTTAVVTSAKLFHKGSQSVTQWQKIAYSLRNSFKLIYAYLPWYSQPTAYCFNLCFYPALWIRWQLRALKKYVVSTIQKPRVS